jgi:hypothetical protein
VPAYSGQPPFESAGHGIRAGDKRSHTRKSTRRYAVRTASGHDAPDLGPQPELAPRPGRTWRFVLAGLTGAYLAMAAIAIFVVFQS